MDKDLTTLFTGRQCFVLPEIDSTNSFLAGIQRREILPEGSAARALFQNAGRGQSGSSWESESGKNLLVSFVFYPSFISPKDVFLLNKTFALGVFDFVKSILSGDVSIKWPNDIYWKDKKVCGLLVENSVISSQITQSIFGIGINVNQMHFADHLPNPVSLSMITGIEFNIDELFLSLCYFIEARYLQLKKGNRVTIEEDYLSSLYLIGKWNDFENNGHIFKGCIRGVDENGRLMIETEEEKVRVFDVKEVKVIQ